MEKQKTSKQILTCVMVEDNTLVCEIDGELAEKPSGITPDSPAYKFLKRFSRDE